MRFTPKIAGSVMPSHAETPEAEATLRILALCLARNITASAAAPWAQFAQATTTNVGDPPSVSMFARICVSAVTRLWCMPVMTSSG